MSTARPKSILKFLDQTTIETIIVYLRSIHKRVGMDNNFWKKLEGTSAKLRKIMISQFLDLVF